MAGLKRPQASDNLPDDDEGDDLDDLFGNLDEDGDCGDDGTFSEGGGDRGIVLPQSPSAPPLNGVDGTSEAQTFRAAFVHIDSHAEAKAQQWSEDAQRAQTILESTSGPSKQSPPPEASPRREGSDEEPGSWLEWQPHGTAHRLSIECVQKAVHRLKSSKTSRFPVQDVVTLLEVARRGALVSEHAVREVEIPGAGRDGSRILVVGDTHGQLEDVLWIFFKHGEPDSKHTVYVFNGDVADRGQNAIDIFMLLTMYSLADPGSVYLNRGNHEDSFLTSVYGYREECLRKYGREAGLYIYSLSRELFNHLALGCIIDAGPGRRYFVVHAGVPRRGASLEDIKKVNYRREIPAPPQAGEDEVFFDCMWADPQDIEGIGSNVRGPHVASFGPDVTEAFLSRSGLDLVIRSHAVPSTGRGVEWHHGGKVLTVFSASNYVGTAGNMGGVAAVRRGEPIEAFEHFAGPREELVRLEAHVQHASAKLRAEAVRLTERRRKRRGRAEGLERMQSQTWDHVKERVVACKHELFEYWTARDESKDFHVSPVVWREGMAHCIGDDLPWEWIQESFEVVEHDKGLVPYTRFLQRFRVAQLGEEDAAGATSSTASPSPKRIRRSFARGWQGVVLRRLFESLLLADLHLRDTLAALDRNADGVVGVSELAAIIADCGMALSPAQCQTLMRALKIRQGIVCSNLGLFEFLDSITVTFSSCCRNAATADESWVPKSLGRVARVLLEDAYLYVQARRSSTGASPPTKGLSGTSPTAPAAASKDDATASGAAQLAPPPPASTEGAAPACGNSHGDSEESIGVAAVGSPPPPWNQSSVAKLLAAWFKKADTDGNGYLSTTELESALEPLANDLEKRGVPNDAASRRMIAQYLDRRGAGRVNYMELLAAMTPVEEAEDGELGPFGEDLIETIALAIYANRAALLCTLRERFDPQGVGTVSTTEFADALSAVSTAVLPRGSDGSTLPQAQIEALASELAGFSSGRVAYEAFIGSFRIVEGLGWSRRGSISFDSQPS